MFSEKIERWKNIMAGFAIFGFILSFILGLIGGVGFGVILLRALLFAAMFAGISLLIMKMIENFVPEVLDGSSIEEDSEFSESSVIMEDETVEDLNNSGPSGRNLDITIEDGDEEFEPAQQEDISETTSPGGRSVEESDLDEEDAEAEEMEELESAGESGAEDEDRKKPVSETEADAAVNGELPDIGVYSDSFETESEDIAGEELSSIDGSGSSGGAEILGSMHETQEIAKAVQTVLKKDQEG